MSGPGDKHDSALVQSYVDVDGGGWCKTAESLTYCAPIETQAVMLVSAAGALLSLGLIAGFIIGKGVRRV